MKSFREDPYTFFLECSCGSNEFERPEGMEKLSGFYEGHFVCSNCKAEHPYYSDFFIKRRTQLSLF